MLYNVPSRTGVDLLPETVRALARHPHIAGIKEACGSISRAAQLLGRCGLPVWSGNDDQTAAIMALGGSGGILCCAVASGPAFEGAGISCGMPGITGAVSHAVYDRGFMLDV